MALKQVFITGGTGSVGEALIKAFSSKSYSITFQYFSNEGKAQSISRETKAIPVKIDFMSDFELPRKDYDIIVNNAGVNIANMLSHNISTKDWNTTQRINVFTPFNIIRSVLPDMINKKWGRIINISSIYGLRGVEWNLPYTVSKHGLSGLTKTIAKEYAEYGITCNEICPGAITSELMDKIALREGKESNHTPEEYIKEVASMNPTKRLAKAEEIASLAVFLASEEAAYINGVSLPIDGGLIA